MAQSPSTTDYLYAGDGLFQQGRRCDVCKHPMPDTDQHGSCLQCLPLDHSIWDCAQCLQFDPIVRGKRRSAVLHAIATKKFPSDWEWMVWGKDSAPPPNPTISDLDKVLPPPPPEEGQGDGVTSNEVMEPTQDAVPAEAPQAKKRSKKSKSHKSSKKSKKSATSTTADTIEESSISMEHSPRREGPFLSLAPGVTLNQPGNAGTVPAPAFDLEKYSQGINTLAAVMKSNQQLQEKNQNILDMFQKQQSSKVHSRMWPLLLRLSLLVRQHLVQFLCCLRRPVPGLRALLEGLLPLTDLLVRQVGKLGPSFLNLLFIEGGTQTCDSICSFFQGFGRHGRCR